MTFDEANALLCRATITGAGLVEDDCSNGGILSIMSNEERRYIWDCVKQCTLPVAEVGAYRGGTAILMALAGAPSVYAIDNDEGTLSRCRANARAAGCTEIAWMHGGSAAMIPLLPECGLILVDACHDYAHTYTDLSEATRKVVVGGWLLVDDVNDVQLQVKQAVEQWAAEVGDAFVLDWYRPETPKLRGYRRMQ